MLDVIALKRYEGWFWKHGKKHRKKESSMTKRNSKNNPAIKDHPVIAKIRKALDKTKDPKRLTEFLASVVMADASARYSPDNCNIGTYALELYWCWDSAHYQLFTFDVETCHNVMPLERILNTPKEDERRKDALWFLLETKNHYTEKAMPPGAQGKCKIIRVSRVIKGTELGIDLNERSLTRIPFSIHYVLEPLFEFNNQGEPIPCDMSRVKAAK